MTSGFRVRSQLPRWRAMRSSVAAQWSASAPWRVRSVVLASSGVGGVVQLQYSGPRARSLSARSAVHLCGVGRAPGCQVVESAKLRVSCLRLLPYVSALCCPSPGQRHLAVDLAFTRSGRQRTGRASACRSVPSEPRLRRPQRVSGREPSEPKLGDRDVVGLQSHLVVVLGVGVRSGA